MIEEWENQSIGQRVNTLHEFVQHIAAGGICKNVHEYIVQQNTPPVPVTTLPQA